MGSVPLSLERLINCFTKLPGIGGKSASKLAYYIALAPDGEVAEFAKSLVEVKRTVGFCRVCGNICEGDVCDYCLDEKRDSSSICVVESFKDLIAIDHTGEYRGRFHVLNGAISPLDGITPDDINLKSLVERVKDGSVKEVILATNPDIEGEATASYIAMLLKPFKPRITRLAYGLPIGAGIEFADSVTLARAFAGRQEF